MSRSGRAVDLLQNWAAGHNTEHTEHKWGTDCPRCMADAWTPWAALQAAAKIMGWLPGEAEATVQRILGQEVEPQTGDIVMLNTAELDRLTRRIMEDCYPPGTVEDGCPAPVWDELLAEAAIPGADIEFLEAWRQKVRDAAVLVGPSIMAAAIDTVQAVRNLFEPSFALVEFSEALIAQLMAVRRGEPWPVPEVAHADGPDADCPHMEFEAGVTVQRILGDNLVVAGFWAEVTVACGRCDEIFRWTGVQPGLSPAAPRVSIDHRTLHAPFHRASRDPDEGQGLPGFDVNLVGPELGHERTAAAIRRRALEDAAELVKSRIQPVMSIAARRELRHAEAELRRLALAAP